NDFTRSLPLSLLVIGLLYLLAQTFLWQNVLNGSQSLDEARAGFRRLTGFAPPDGMGGGANLTFVGRHIVMLGEHGGAGVGGPDDLSTFVVYMGPLAGRPTPEQRFKLVEDRLRLMNVPWF